MTHKFEQGKQEIIESVLALIRKNMSPIQQELCTAFAKKFLATVSTEDLAEWQIEDLYGAMANYWSLLMYRTPGECKIRIYNPDYEQHGWQSTHTVIEIIHEDIPFLVDSVIMEISRMGLTPYLTMHMGGLKVIRDEDDNLLSIGAANTKSKTKESRVTKEALQLIQINRVTDLEILQELHLNLGRVLNDTRRVVEDWPKMRERLLAELKVLDNYKAFIDEKEIQESKDFLTWMENHHFTFLGIRNYKILNENGETLLCPVDGTGLGILNNKHSDHKSCRNLSKMSPEAKDMVLSKQLLILSKTNTRATVHRPVYTDYIGIKQFNAKGEVVGEVRIIGLYTSAAYNTNPTRIPLLRNKVSNVMNLTGVEPTSHAGKVIQNIIDTLPRDDLFQATEEELLEISMGIFHLQERRRFRLFMRKDIYRRFLSCLVYIPRDLFNTKLRTDIQKTLVESVGALESSFSTRFSESVLCRTHFILKIDPYKQYAFDVEEIEQKIIEVARNWCDSLNETLLEGFGEEESTRLFQKYENAFSNSYKESFTARTAVYDIRHIEELTGGQNLGMSFYRPVSEFGGKIRLKLYQESEPLPLSDVLPILENMGLRVISERVYIVKPQDSENVWLNDFSMLYVDEVNVDEVKELFQQAFSSIWYQKTENDGFNQLVLSAHLSWREVSILRAYAKYFKQIRSSFSPSYIQNALNCYPNIAKLLVNIFNVRFSSENNLSADERFKQEEELRTQVFSALESVDSLDEDKIIRGYLELISATLRTNYFQKDEQGHTKSYLSFKFNPRKISDLPKPYPMYEIFVYSPRFEGVHLRCGKVARGGLRWSDRPEDFRTEILGLMKAQQVKNSVIVPNGAKGGFVPKQLLKDGTREDIMAEGIFCYQNFIRGLLDVSDNYVSGEISKPDNTVCYDDDDPYLVVAADKGTATFSDIANKISNEYNFWLGDAFASGGSDGYDHKKMGITARGAWESVKRHFRELGKDIQTTPFTCIGIGDMSGDVFGNGMLLSECTQLVVAFNHLHIFIDPNPDEAVAYLERKRLFELPRSAWTDYDAKKISKGGGVFLRSAKSIQLSAEIKELFSIEKNHIEPNELIRIILKSEVDLLWSAGIGTFVKGADESHDDVGDRANDSIRINGNELRCRVVGEGGNLGLTQLARIDYAMKGGLIYTDFIDNSAGVDCSDNEVNIKILLNSVVANGELTTKQRNQLLVKMTDEVSQMVLHDNYQQTQAISLAAEQAYRNVELHSRYIDELEQEGKLDRELEFIPDKQQLIERKLAGKGLARPGLSVLLCYSKTLLYEELIKSSVPEDPYLKKILVDAFPKPLQKKYQEYMQAHPLKREIIATKLSNIVVNEMGFTFVYRLHDETGAPYAAIVKAYMIVRSLFDLPSVWQNIQAVDNKAPTSKQTEIILQMIRIARRATRWFLRAKRLNLDITSNVKLYKEGISEFMSCITPIVKKYHSNLFNDYVNESIEQGIPELFAKEMAGAKSLFAAMDIIDAAQERGIDIATVADAYFAMGDFLDLNWIRTRIILMTVENHWEALTREALRDDLDWQQRKLTIAILCLKDESSTVPCPLDLEGWANRHQDLIKRWQYILAELRSTQSSTFTMYFVAIRELLDLTQTSVQSVKKLKEKASVDDKYKG